MLLLSAFSASPWDLHQAQGIGSSDSISHCEIAAPTTEDPAHSECNLSTAELRFHALPLTLSVPTDT